MGMYYGNVVLVTGASSGIGKSIAEYLAKMGYRVYGTSRKAQEAVIFSEDKDSGGLIKMLQLDVRSEESVKKAIETIIAAEGELGIVINNAGMGIAGSVEDTSYEEAMLQFDTNFFGVHRVIRNVLPYMRKHGRGLIINMSSVGAVFPIPYQSMYVASKAATEGMTGSLRNELRPFGIKVAMVEPGDTKTGFTASRVFVKAGGKESPYYEYAQRSVAVMEHDEMNGADPEAIARVVAKLIKRKNPPLCSAVGFMYKALVFMKRLVPRSFEAYIVSRMYKG
jgi:short-subunit dehydrogenase